MEEIWRDIQGYEGLYQVSNFGRVKSLKTNRILKGSQINSGYLEVVLCKNKIHKHLLVHRLVAQAFIENSNNKKEVNHIDGDKQNNNVINLEWVTRSENELHSYQSLGKKNKVVNKKAIYLIDEQGNKQEFNSIKACAKFLNVNDGLIHNYIKEDKKYKGYTFERIN